MYPSNPGSYNLKLTTFYSEINTIGLCAYKVSNTSHSLISTGNNGTFNFKVLQVA